MKRRFLTAAIIFLILGASCTTKGDFKDATPDPSATATPGRTQIPSDTQGVTHVEVWFTAKERLSVVYERIEPTRTPAQQSLELLIKGPSDRDLFSAIPENVELNGVTIDDGTATVDFSKEFEEGGGTLQMTMRLAQVVFTVTQFASVEDVIFEIDGKRVTTFSGEGLDTSNPLRRDDEQFKERLPAILVTSPRPGQSYSRQIKFEGDANVFEANVSLKIVDENGKMLGEGFVTATCGTGCRGTFSKTLTFEVDEPTEGFAEAYESSAKDGSVQNLVRVPVVLQP